jgi:hypothetical protein
LIADSCTIGWDLEHANLALIPSSFAGLVNPRIREGRSGAKFMVALRRGTFLRRLFRIR